MKEYTTSANKAIAAAVASCPCSSIASDSTLIPGVIVDTSNCVLLPDSPSARGVLV